MKYHESKVNIFLQFLRVVLNPSLSFELSSQNITQDLHWTKQLCPSQNIATSALFSLCKEED